MGSALGSFRESYWLQNLLVRLMERSPEVMALMGEDPFEGKAPKYLRCKLYEYTFPEPSKIMNDGQWWERKLLGDYSPVLEKR